MPFSLELILLFVTASIVGYAVLSIIMRLWQEYAILDRPHLYKTESGREPVPYGVGIAIIITLLILAPSISYFFDISASLEHKLHIVLALAAIIGIVSFVDDLDTIGKSRWRVSPILRLLMQI